MYVRIENVGSLKSISNLNMRMQFKQILISEYETLVTNSLPEYEIQSFKLFISDIVNKWFPRFNLSKYLRICAYTNNKMEQHLVQDLLIFLMLLWLHPVFSGFQLLYLVYRALCTSKRVDNSESTSGTIRVLITPKFLRFIVGLPSHLVYKKKEIKM